MLCRSFAIVSATGTRGTGRLSRSINSACAASFALNSEAMSPESETSAVQRFRAVAKSGGELIEGRKNLVDPVLRNAGHLQGLHLFQAQRTQSA